MRSPTAPSAVACTAPAIPASTPQTTKAVSLVRAPSTPAAAAAAGCPGRRPRPAGSGRGQVAGDDHGDQRRSARPDAGRATRSSRMSHRWNSTGRSKAPGTSHGKFVGLRKNRSTATAKVRVVTASSCPETRRAGIATSTATTAPAAPAAIIATKKSTFHSADQVAGDHAARAQDGDLTQAHRPGPAGQDDEGDRHHRVAWWRRWPC